MATPPFAELHCHTNFSFLDGASESEDLVERALELGLSGLAATDHQGLYGAVRFASAAREAGLHPVTGMEVELLDAAVAGPGPDRGAARRRPPRGRRAPRPRGSLPARSSSGPPAPETAGRGAQDGHAGPAGAGAAARPRPPGAAARGPARDPRRSWGRTSCCWPGRMEGYRSLCRLASGAHLAGTKGVPRFTHALLAEETAGLIALTGCRHGELSRRLLAGDREGALAAAARRASARAVRGTRSTWSSSTTCCRTTTGSWRSWRASPHELSLPTVVTNDAHYARPEDRELQDVLVCIRHGLTLEDGAHLRRPNGQSHLKGAAELLALPPGAAGGGSARPARAWREGIARSGEIAAAARGAGVRALPLPGLPRARRGDAVLELARLCNDGARRRYHPLTPRGPQAARP